MDAGQPLGNDQLELLFLGTGTSAGVPMIACHCETCTSTDPHDKRMRPSVVISYDSRATGEQSVEQTPDSRRATHLRVSSDAQVRCPAATGQLCHILIDTTPELRLQC